MKQVVVFPGQGSQFIGMGQVLAESNAHISERFHEANEILGYLLTDIMFVGPEEELKQTRNTQPAIFLHSVALFETLDLNPVMTAGHSLGEFSALCAAGALSFDNALEIVALRGRLMQEAGESNPGTMAAVIGMEDDAVEKVCADASELIGKPVVAANYNCPGQLVISGDVDAVNKAVDLAGERGCRMAKVLPVSGAFHSPLMRTAFDGLKAKLEEIEILTPKFPVYSNYSAKPTTNPDELRSNLLDQLMNPVRWTQTMQNMYNDGARSFTEVGPGKVLQGLVKRTLNEIEIHGYQ